jgi:hypothetical protein
VHVSSRNVFAVADMEVDQGITKVIIDLRHLNHTEWASIYHITAA